MGYNVDYSGRIEIAKDRIDECLSAINELHTDENLLKLASGGRYGKYADQQPVREHKWYSWVENPDEGGFKTIQDAFDAWRIFDDAYADNTDEQGNFVHEGWYGNKLGQQAVLLSTIAPFANDTFIECSGEDGALWAWDITDGIFTEKNGTVTYN